MVNYNLNPYHVNRYIKYGDDLDSEHAKHTVQVHSINPINMFPFSFLTISSLAHAYTRAFGVHSDDDLPILHDGGVPAAVSKASNEELECLYYYHQTRFPDLIYGVGRQKTFRINGKLRHVDGYSADQGGLIIEYLGCYWHGK